MVYITKVEGALPTYYILYTTYYLLLFPSSWYIALFGMALEGEDIAYMRHSFMLKQFAVCKVYVCGTIIA